MAELLIAILFICIALFGYIALQMRLIDSNEKLVRRQTALQEAETQMAQSASSIRRADDLGMPRLSPTVAKAAWTDRNGHHTYTVDTLSTRVRPGW